MEEVTKKVDPKREALRRAVRYFYDTQKLRIASGNRAADPDSYKIVEDKKTGKEKKVKKNVSKAQMNNALEAVLAHIRPDLLAEEGVQPERTAPPTLDEQDREYLQRQQHVLMLLEGDTLKRISELLKDIPIAAWISQQKGIGPTMAGVLVSEIDITKCDTPSALWAYAGLHTDLETGAAVRRRRGQVANWNSFLKTKTVKVMAECMIKANSDWRVHYDSYKMRKTNQLVDVCMSCQGAGKLKAVDDEFSNTPLGKQYATLEEAERALGKEEVERQMQAAPPKGCSNCKGTGGPAPWGRSQAHRDQAAKRYMVKMFLLELWKKWRELEGLPVVPSYAEAALGRVHGDHGGMNLTAKGEAFKPAPRRFDQARP